MAAEPIQGCIFRPTRKQLLSLRAQLIRSAIINIPQKCQKHTLILSLLLENKYFFIISKFVILIHYNIFVKIQVSPINNDVSHKPGKLKQVFSCKSISYKCTYSQNLHLAVSMINWLCKTELKIVQYDNSKVTIWCTWGKILLTQSWFWIRNRITQYYPCDFYHGYVLLGGQLVIIRHIRHRIYRLTLLFIGGRFESRSGAVTLPLRVQVNNRLSAVLL